jgi:hypothetical protein
LIYCEPGGRHVTINDRFKEEFAAIAEQNGLLDEEVLVRVKPLTAQQAIGTPERNDFPLQKGKERIIEAAFKGQAGQAFTDSFTDYRDCLSGLLGLDLTDRFNLSIFFAAANAVLRQLGLASGTIHCRDKEPTQCAPKLVEYIAEKYPEARRIALVGLQPAMAEALAPAYDLTILDLDPDNIGRQTSGVPIQDGRRDLAQAVDGSDLVVATGSTLTNNTMDTVLAAAGDRPVVWFGITVSGAAALLGLERFCPLGH